MAKKTTNKIKQGYDKTLNTADRVRGDKKLRRHIKKSGKHLKKASSHVASSKSKKKALNSDRVHKELHKSALEANKAVHRYQNPPKVRQKIVKGVVAVAALIGLAAVVKSKTGGDKESS